MQCARGLCLLNNVAEKHEAEPDAFQEKQIPIVLPDLRAHPHLSMPMTQGVAPAAIRQFMQAGSVVAHTNLLAAKARSISADSADGYLAREIMSTGLALT